MHSRALRLVALSGLVVVTAVAARAIAAPTTPVAGTGTAPVGTAGPRPTARPQAPRIVGVRAAPGVYTSGRFGFEIELENPLETTVTVLAVIWDPQGSASYTLRPKQRAWFPFSRATLIDACTERQRWTMWLAETPDDKRAFEMTPNCTFKAKTPTFATATPTAAPVGGSVLGRITYGMPEIKDAAPTCGQPFRFASTVTNRTNAAATLTLDWGPNLRGKPFTVPAGGSVEAIGGQEPFTGVRGPMPVVLRGVPTPSNPAIVPNAGAEVGVTAECRPSFRMLVVTP